MKTQYTYGEVTADLSEIRRGLMGAQENNWMGGAAIVLTDEGRLDVVAGTDARDFGEIVVLLRDGEELESYTTGGDEPLTEADIPELERCLAEEIDEGLEAIEERRGWQD